MLGQLMKKFPNRQEPVGELQVIITKRLATTANRPGYPEEVSESLAK